MYIDTCTPNAFFTRGFRTEMMAWKKMHSTHNCNSLLFSIISTFLPGFPYIVFSIGFRHNSLKRQIHAHGRESSEPPLTHGPPLTHFLSFAGQSPGVYTYMGPHMGPYVYIYICGPIYGYMGRYLGPYGPGPHGAHVGAETPGKVRP